MGRVTACRACKEAKRKCTKQQPKCKRCISKSVECVYSRRSSFIIYGAQGSGDSAATSDSFSTLAAPRSATHPATSIAAYHRGSGAQSSLSTVRQPSLLDLRSAWFLTPESWTVSPIFSKQTLPVPSIVLKSFIVTLQGWLRQWVETGSNPFIHAELYRKDLPIDIQDAFTALSTYLARSAATEEMIMMIVEARADRVANTQQESHAPTPDFFARLGKIQALLVLVVMQLFNGDIRQRHLGEQHLSVLHEWCREILLHALQRAQSGLLLLDVCSQLPSDLQTSTASEASDCRDQEQLLWRAWILLESVRRTWSIAETLRAIYLTMKDGNADCPGSTMLTTRKGAWEAGTALEWTRVCAEKSIGFMHRNDTARVFTECSPTDIDPFSLTFLELDFGLDKVRAWGSGPSQSYAYPTCF
ncbi:Zn(2)-C6 fungal-type DNA-binding domain protein [Moelleriella libera RCEF 2490]|uniref:Zn(2)-C6 fungal-type DNA-binding domain protein n=1 Tax=Moelleriella libera RCEF 2490 TaxID=1081109 RepID=A0A167Y4S0_9HYPO|nr:Zn(2)-C6 fungal-type DNA-binding domain protein [Moelleriella libera RCEF 2490]